MLARLTCTRPRLLWPLAGVWGQTSAPQAAPAGAPHVFVQGSFEHTGRTRPQGCLMGVLLSRKPLEKWRLPSEHDVREHGPVAAVLPGLPGLQA